MKPPARVILPIFITCFFFLLINVLDKPTIHWSFDAVNYFNEVNNVRFFSTEKHNEEYCIAYNFLKANGSFQEGDLQPVTLTTHGTSELISTFEKHASNWDGPVSIGIFIDFTSMQALEYLDEVHRCDKEFRMKTSIHFAFRLSPFQDRCQPIPIHQNNRTCKEFLKNRDKIRKQVAGPFQLYPYNVMRNMARRGAQSDLHLLIDGDMIPCRHFAKKVKKIANKVVDGKSKRVLIVRRFESNVTHVPEDHIELQTMIKKQQVHEFHHKFFFKGHQIENITYWLQESNRSKELVSWQIPYSNMAWEPQPIIHRNDLYNADYFPARIKDMTSLIYKLCRADYTFHLVSHVFDVHYGIKTSDSIFSKAVIAHQKAFARAKAASRFDKEMKTLYPNTLKKCGKFVL